MAVALTTGIELPEQATPFRGGLLDRSLDLPEGWSGGGVVVPWYGCGEPIVRDKCITATDVPKRGEMVEYQPFPIEQGVTCSTLGNLNLPAHARGRLESTIEWGLARQLQSDLAGTGSPKLDDATSVGSTDDVVAAVALLEEAAALAGFGTPWVIHGPVYVAAFLRDHGLIDDDGRSPAGGQFIISPGYLREGDITRLWVTGPVWAGVETATVREAIGHRINSADAWALTWALVAFDPCINFYVDLTPCSTCGGGGTGGGATPAEVQAIIDAQSTLINNTMLVPMQSDLQSVSYQIRNEINSNVNTKTAAVTTAVNAHTDTATAAVTTDVNENTDAEVQASTTTITTKLDELFPESP